MKHKFLTSALSAAAILCLGLGLAACGGNGGSNENPEDPADVHHHTFTVDNVCSGCGEKWEYTEGLTYELYEGIEDFVDQHEVSYMVSEPDDEEALSGDIVIPYGYNGKWVRAIDSSAFYGCSKITGITIPESVNCIMPDAFANCTSLTSIVIPDSVTSLGLFAFEGCSALKSVKIGKNVETFGYSLFTECSALTELELPDSALIFDDCGIEETALYQDPANWDENGTLYIGNHLIKSKGTQAGTFTVRAGTKTIADGAFKNQTYPEKEEYTYAMTEIVLPDGLLTIGKDAFYDCSALNAITIPDSVVSIQDDFAKTAYYQDQSHWDDGKVLYVGNHLIEAKDLTGSYTVRAGTKSIAPHAFDGCSGLSAINLPDSIVSIGEYAFRDCTALVNITIPDAVKKIERRTFDGCTSLESIKLGSGLETIAWVAFPDCKALKSLTIPASVTKLGYYLFENCEALESLQVEEGNKIFRSEGNCILNIASNSVIIAGCKTTTIPEGVTRIGVAAFYGTAAPVNVTIPDSVTEIGTCAFMNCSSLVSIKLPKNLTEIDEAMFNRCSSLESIVIPDSVTKIGRWAFDECSSLVSIELSKNLTEISEAMCSECSSLESIVIPDSVTKIGEKAFENCSALNTITIGKGVTEIGERALDRCQNLTSVTFAETEGWVCHIIDYATGTQDRPVPSENLAIPELAAYFLVRQYSSSNCYWTRS